MCDIPRRKRKRKGEKDIQVDILSSAPDVPGSESESPPAYSDNVCLACPGVQRSEGVSLRLHMSAPCQFHVSSTPSRFLLGRITACVRRISDRFSRRRRYDACFLKWYSESEYCPSISPCPGALTVCAVEYLRGNGKTDDNECAKLFKDYQKCLKVGDNSHPTGA